MLDAFQIRYGLDPERGAALEFDSASSDRHTLGRSADERNLLLLAMVEVAVADGVLDPAELKRLRKVAGAMGVTDQALMARIHQRLA